MSGPPAGRSRGPGSPHGRPWLAGRVAALPLRTRLLIAIIALLAAVCLVVGSISLLLLRGFLIYQLDSQVLSVADRFDTTYGRKSCDTEDNGGPPCFLFSSGLRVGTLSGRIADGQVRESGVLDSEGTPRGISRAEDEDLLAVPRDGVPHTRRIGGLGQYRVVAVTRPDKGADFVTGLPMDEVNNTLVQLGWIELVVAACGLVVAGAVSTVIVRVTLRPLRRVAATAGRVAERRLDRGEVALAERVPVRDTDVRTEVGQVGAALNRMLEHVAGALEARQASESQLRRFLADASHELRTPLAAIRGYTELTLRSEGDLSPDVAYALRRVSSQADRMTSLVEDMLLLARLDAGRPLAYEPVDLSRLVVDAVSDAHVAGPDHRWVLRVPEEAVVISGDGARLAQVLGNLLTNARVHTPAGTTVRAELEPGPGWVVVRVIDDGPGIAPELLPRVFGRFARGDESRSRAAGSTGLGLAIAHAVVSAHQGRVGVRSVPGHTEFTVWLLTFDGPNGRGGTTTGGPHRGGADHVPNRADDPGPNRADDPGPKGADDPGRNGADRGTPTSTEVDVVHRKG
jgi:two-component system, OmpR family, sensor kinase